MNIINVGDPRTISLLAGQTISVTTTGTITATCVSGLGLTAGATIGSIHGSTVFGSYSADGVIKLTATNRDGAYELNTDTSAQIKSVAGTAGVGVLDTVSNVTLAQSLYKRAPRLRKLQSAISKVLAGTGQCYIGVVGDSTTVGAGAGTGAKYAINARPLSPTAQLAAALVSAGIPATDDSWFGENLLEAFQGVTRVQYDTRFTVSASAAYYPNGAYQSLGGIPFRLNSAGKAVNFTPTNTVDRVDVYSYNKTAGVFDLSFAGGASLGAVTNAVTATVQKTTKSLTRGTGVLQAIWVSGDNSILGMVAYDSTVPRVNVMNWGCYGDKLTTANGYANNTNEWRGGSVITTVAPDAVIVDMTINTENNDGLAGVAAYKTALTTICNDVIAAGADLILATPHYINSTTQTSGICDAYVAAIREVAVTFSAPIVDVYRRLDDYTTFNTQGMYTDSLHLTAAGYRAKILETMRVINVWA